MKILLLLLRTGFIAILGEIAYEIHRVLFNGGTYWKETKLKFVCKVPNPHCAYV